MNCFRKISENAFDALQYFQLHFPDQTLEKLLVCFFHEINYLIQ